MEEKKKFRIGATIAISRPSPVVIPYLTVPPSLQTGTIRLWTRLSLKALTAALTPRLQQRPSPLFLEHKRGCGPDGESVRSPLALPTMLPSETEVDKPCTGSRPGGKVGCATCNLHTCPSLFQTGVRQTRVESKRGRRTSHLFAALPPMLATSCFLICSICRFTLTIPDFLFCLQKIFPPRGAQRGRQQVRAPSSSVRYRRAALWIRTWPP